MNEEFPNEHPPFISRFSSSRLDPFIKYPIKLTRRTQGLLDHSEWLSVISRVQIERKTADL